MIKTYPCEGGDFIVTDLGLLPFCALKKMESDDGYWRYKKTKTFIGKLYRYSPKSRSVRSFHNAKKHVDFKCEIVMVHDERGFFAAMPVECLSFHPAGQ